MPDTLEESFTEASNDLAEVSPAETEALGTPEQGQVEVEQPAVSTDSPKHQVKVRGQETEVEYDELVNGYQRQSDYTQAKQELAQERQQIQAAATLWEHLQENPEATLAALQEHYGEFEQPDSLTEEELRLQQVEAFQEQQRQSAIENEISSEMDRLSSKFGDFIRDDLLEFAIENEIPNLEAALLYKRSQDEHTAGEATRLAAKRAAPPTVGGSVAAGTSAAGQAPIDSFDDALGIAMKELGSSSILDFIGN